MNQFPETAQADAEFDAFLDELEWLTEPIPVPRPARTDGRERLKAAYTNDRREGRTNPDLVEIIEADDPRHHSNQGKRTVLNRADRRARGRYVGKAIRKSPRPTKAITHPLNSLVLAAKRAARELEAAKAAHPAHQEGIAA